MSRAQTPALFARLAVEAFVHTAAQGGNTNMVMALASSLCACSSQDRIQLLAQEPLLLRKLISVGGARTSSAKSKECALVALLSLAEAPENAKIMVAFPPLVPVLVAIVGRTGADEVRSTGLAVLAILSATCAESIFTTPGLVAVLVEAAGNGATNEIKKEALRTLANFPFSNSIAESMFTTPGLVAVLVETVDKGATKDLKTQALRALGKLSVFEPIAESMFATPGLVAVLVGAAHKGETNDIKVDALELLSNLTLSRSMAASVFTTPGLVAMLVEAVNKGATNVLQLQALKVLSNLAISNKSVAESMFTPDFVAVLVEAVDKGATNFIKMQAMTVLGNLSLSKKSIAEAMVTTPGLVSVFVEAVDHGATKDFKQHALYMLGILSSTVALRDAEIKTPRIVATLLKAVYSGVAVDCALKTLHWLASTSDALGEAMLRDNPRLLNIVLSVVANKNNNIAVKTVALWTLRDLAASAANAVVMFDTPLVVQVVLEAAAPGATSDVKEEALLVLRNLAVVPRNREPMSRLSKLLDAAMDAIRDGDGDGTRLRVRLHALQVLWALSESRPANDNLLRVPGLVDAVLACCSSAEKEALAVLRGLSVASSATVVRTEAVLSAVTSCLRSAVDPIIRLRATQVLASLQGPMHITLECHDDPEILEHMVGMVQAAVTGANYAEDGTISLLVALTPLRALAVVASNRVVLAEKGAVKVVEEALRLATNGELAERHGEASVVEELCVGVLGEFGFGFGLGGM